MIVYVWGTVIKCGTYWIDIINKYSNSSVVIGRKDLQGRLSDNKKVVFYGIPEELEREYRKKYQQNKDEGELQCYWLQHFDDEYYSFFKRTLLEIKSTNAITAVVCVKGIPKSLDSVCKELGIITAVIENAVTCTPPFDIPCGTLLFNSEAVRNGKKECDARYKKFREELETENITIYSRKELFALFLNPKSWRYLVPKTKKYDIGLALAGDTDPKEDFGGWGDNEISMYLINKYKLEDNDNCKILLRIKPGSHKERIIKQNRHYILDKSKDALDFVLKCHEVYAISIGVPYTSIIAGIKTYYVVDEDYDCNRECEISDNSVEYANFIVFGLYTPWKLIFDEEYIKYRLSEPEETKIYETNRKYILNTYLNESTTGKGIVRFALKKLVYKIKNKG